jgi:DNA polymerase
MIVSDAWTEEDLTTGKLFSGATGSLLRGCLATAGISMAEAYITAVFSSYMGDIKSRCGPKAEAIKGWPAIATGKYVPSRYAAEIERLKKEISDVRPVAILALGQTATWALLRETKLKKIRGAPLYCDLVPDLRVKLLPTYHPGAIFKEWKLRPVFLADLFKLREELEYPEIRRPYREVWIEPDLDDLYRFEREHISPSPDLSIDIETSGTSITCIGFAPRPDIALVVPFTSAVEPTNYWPDLATELKVWAWVRKMCGLNKRITGQNILYDVHHLWRNYGIPVPHVTNDSMLLHHALQPEMEKGLAFLGSVYTREAAWKFMGRTKVDTIKRED